MKKRVSLYIEAELAKALRVFAATNNTNASAVVTELLKVALEVKK